MADELIDVLDESGKKTGKQVIKSEAHKNRLWHAAVHIWIFNSRGGVLLQKRKATKQMHPLKWDISVAGHLAAGEDPIEAAVRGVEEEKRVRGQPV